MPSPYLWTSEKVHNLLENLPCDLCGKTDEEFLFIEKGVITNYPFRVVHCRSCGFIYINPKINKQAIADLYDEAYYNGRGFDSNATQLNEIHSESDENKKFRPGETVKIIKDLVPPPATLLDFGCGLGDFIKQAQKHGYEAEGFEVSKFGSELVRNNGIDVYTNINEIPRGRYDVVTAIEVLEHCYSPMESLKAIYNSLRPGGIFYYTTVSFDGFYKKWKLGIKDYRKGYILPEGHINFFSTSVMKSYFRKIGFSRSFFYLPKKYQKNKRSFKLLSKLKLIDGVADEPKQFHEKVLYYGAQKALKTLGTGAHLLPLAIK
jgi:2-polyprenyl-3-methyl-5-hydroxy-6-metoxy-1,4-benzoquinol methylase